MSNNEENVRGYAYLAESLNKLTYVFLGRPIVELIGLDAHQALLLKLNLEEGSVGECLMNLILLLISMQGSCPKRHLPILARQELFLVGEGVTDV